jgi:hypothetical protein
MRRVLREIASVVLVAKEINTPAAYENAVKDIERKLATDGWLTMPKLNVEKSK